MKSVPRTVIVAAVLCAAGAAQAQILQLPEGLPGGLGTAINASLRVNVAPPALRQEVQPPQPGPNFFWIGGYWNWRPRQEQYVWVPGHWEQERPNFHWSPAGWVQRGGEYVFMRGRWVREDATPDTSTGIWVASPPPAPPPEVPPPAPSALHIWIGGHYDWNPQRVQYAWVPGHYEMRREGYVWVPVRWEPVAERWRYVPGHWQRQ